MAIDTENKRRSVQNYSFTGILPVADGVIDANDRAMVTGLYAGFSSGPAGSGFDYATFARQKGRR